MIGESFRMSLKIRFNVIDVLNPKLKPEMNMAALIQQTPEKNRFLCGITEQDSFFTRQGSFAKRPADMIE